MVSSSPWLRGLLRAGKKQQRSATRALTILLTPAKPAKKAAKPKAPAKPRAPAKATGAPGGKLPAALKAASAPRPSAPAKPSASAKPRAQKAPPARPPAGASVRRVPLAPLPPVHGKWLAAHYAEPGNSLRRMSYWLYLPTTAPKRGGWPLLVMLHGCEQSATMFAEGTRMNQWAEKAGFAVVYPQQSVSTHPHRCWKWYDRATQQGGGDVPAIVGIVRQVMGGYPIDAARVYICGISAGAGMANIVAVNHPTLFAALGMHSGPLYGAGHSTVGALGVMQHGAQSRTDSAIVELVSRSTGIPAMPTMLIHGDDDPVVRPVNQVQLERQAMLLNRLGPDSRVELMHKPGGKRVHPHSVRDVYHGAAVMLRVARIAELKHAWSGGDERVSFHSGAGPDASKMLLDFFAKHRRRA